MSKNIVDRRKSTFKARDNVEIIMNKIFTFIESNLSSEIVPQIENAGSWKVENDKAKIEISFDSVYRNLDGKTIILQCAWDNKVGASTTSTWLMGNYRTRLIDALNSIGIPYCIKEDEIKVIEQGNNEWYRYLLEIGKISNKVQKIIKEDNSRIRRKLKYINQL